MNNSENEFWNLDQIDYWNDDYNQCELTESQKKIFNEYYDEESSKLDCNMLDEVDSPEATPRIDEFLVATYHREVQVVGQKCLHTIHE